MLRLFLFLSRFSNGGKRKTLVPRQQGGKIKRFKLEEKEKKHYIHISREWRKDRPSSYRHTDPLFSSGLFFHFFFFPSFFFYLLLLFIPRSKPKGTGTLATHKTTPSGGVSPLGATAAPTKARPPPQTQPWRHHGDGGARGATDAAADLRRPPDETECERVPS